jgi:mRNA interferase MazF
VKVRQGEVWFADYGSPFGREQGGRRPAVVLSRTRFNESRLGLVITAPLTTRERGWPQHIPVLPGASGLRQPSWAMTEQLRSISADRLLHRIGHVEQDTMSKILEVVGEHLF